MLSEENKELIANEICALILLIIFIPYIIYDWLFGDKEEEKRIKKELDERQNATWGYYSHKLYGKEFNELTDKQQNEVVKATKEDPYISMLNLSDPSFLI